MRFDGRFGKIRFVLHLNHLSIENSLSTFRNKAKLYIDILIRYFLISYILFIVNLDLDWRM